MLKHPNPNALEHSNRLLAAIMTDIKRNHGLISFADYMNLALYAPGLGYYVSGAQKFNVGGDFTTAPEISSLFSECLAKQCQQILPLITPKAKILEFGAGTGRMAADILQYLDKKKMLPEHYYILELSPELKKRQKQTMTDRCPHLLPKTHWLNSVPDEFSGIILANEVLDAMPVERFQIKENNIDTVMVAEKEGVLSETLSTAKEPEILELFHSKSWPDLYTSEINLNIYPWIKSLSKCLKQGVVLLIDYGFSAQEYYHPQRTTGTLMCHYQHHAHHDPFRYPGLQDITAHVNFSAVHQAAKLSGLDILGYTSQASFLLGCGLIDLLSEKNLATEKEKTQQNHAINLLTSPAEMGELFKVIMLGKNIETACIGFEFSDRQHTLIL
jgi:SAM-dependent MidA family methyltransferase